MRIFIYLFSILRADKNVFNRGTNLAAMIAERKGYSSKKPRKTNRFSGFFAVLGGKTWFFETRKKDLILRLQNGGFSKKQVSN